MSDALEELVTYEMQHIKNSLLPSEEKDINYIQNKIKTNQKLKI